MRNSTLLFALCLAMTSCGQKLPTKEIPAVDGDDYVYVLYPKQDSLRWYNPGQDTFKVTVLFEKISAGYPLPEIITQVDDNFFGEEYAQPLGYVPAQFSGDNIINPLGWNFGKGQIFNVAHHKNTLAFLQTDGWVEYTFHGYKIEYWAEQRESYGIAGVSIDKGPEVMVDLYNPEETNNSRLVFTADSLSQENNVAHVIRVRYTAQRNPNANSGAARINLDKFTTYQRQGVYYVPKVPTPARMQYEQPKPSNE